MFDVLFCNDVQAPRGVHKLTLDAPTPDDVILGVTHLLIGGKLMRLYKCPFCNFQNIHEDEITHHIRYKEDNLHNVDVNTIDPKRYIVTNKEKEKESKYHYERKEDLPLPWIKCLWCNYQDKVVIDLEWHLLEKHKDRLYKIKACRYDDVEYLLSKAIRLAKRKTGRQDNKK